MPFRVLIDTRKGVYIRGQDYRALLGSLICPCRHRVRNKRNKHMNTASDRDEHGNTLIVDIESENMTEEELFEYQSNWAHPMAASGWTLIYDYDSVDGFVNNEDFLEIFDASVDDFEDIVGFTNFLLEKYDFLSELTYNDYENKVVFCFGFIKENISLQKRKEALENYFAEGDT